MSEKVVTAAIIYDKRYGKDPATTVGQPVVAAGSPLALTSTVTSGTVSALNRSIDVGQGGQPGATVPVTYSRHGVTGPTGTGCR